MSLRDDERAARFLTRHGMYYGQIDAPAQLDKLMREIDRALDKKGGDLKMIPSFLGDLALPAQKRRISVMDIGGTHMRSALMSAGPDGLELIGDVHTHPTPGVGYQINAEDFFREIVLTMQDDLCCDDIGICFSYAAIPQPGGDAVVEALGKELMVSGLVGRSVGAELTRAMKKIGLPTARRVRVLNDTVAAALCGFSLRTDTPFDGCLGFIYGTGTNLCYREPALAMDLVNVESGAYGGFPAGDIDDAYDLTLVNAGEDRFEKMVSGGFQGGLMMHVLEQAVKEGELCGETLHRIRHGCRMRKTGKGQLDASDISAFAAAPAGSSVMAAACVNEADRAWMLQICDLITERSALLCSIVLTAGLIRARTGLKSDRPARILAEGSTFLKQKDFRKKLEKNMQLLAGEKHGLSWRFETAEHAVLTGTAAACCCGIL